LYRNKANEVSEFAKPLVKNDTFGRPRIVLADRVFMTPFAMKLLESAGVIVWVPERTEVQGATVIVAELLGQCSSRIIIAW